MDDLLNASASTIAQSIHSKEVSSVEFLSALLKRIEKINPKINAIIQLDVEQALQQAEQMDALLAQGRVLGPLHGVPFTVKDMYNTKGITTTLGTLGLRDFVPSHDATLVRRMKQAGGILIGKTNVPELCTAAETTNLVYGETLNPYELTRTPGGSSGGEAAAIAAAISPVGIGSDLGGSLRIPAHYCGVTSIRPTVGRIACSMDLKGNQAYGIRTGVEALLAVDGPIARYSEDLYSVLKVISGSDGIDPYAEDVALRDPAEISIQDLKIGYFVDNGVQSPTDDIAAHVDLAVDCLLQAGARLSEDPPVFMRKALDLIVQIFSSANYGQSIEAALLHFGTRQFSDSLRKFLDRIKRESGTYHDMHQAWHAWDYYRSDLNRYIHPYDAVICPVLPFTAMPLGQSIWDDAHFPALSYCLGMSLQKFPIATVCVGRDNNDLPIGLQVVTKPWREDIALAIAYHLQRHLGGWRPPELLND